MRSKLVILALLILSSSITAFSQGEGQTRAPEAPPTDTAARDIPGVVKGGTKVQVVIASVPGHGDPKSGCAGCTEGPIALPDGSIAYIETSYMGRVMKIDKEGNTSTLVDEATGNHPNGLAWDFEGRLIAATNRPGHEGVQAIYPKGKEAVLAEKFEGKPFGRPNDLCVDKKGGIYFTDPANMRNPPMPPGVYYIPPGGGKVIKVADGIEFPNGVSISPDGKVLYVNNTEGEYLLAFDIQKDGTVTNRRNFAKYEGLTTRGGKITGGGDGFTIDTKGRVYTAAGDSVQVFSPAGKPLGQIPTPRRPQNLAFAGPDMKTLWIVGGGGVFKVQMVSQGIKDRGGK
jgi:gluconolactonase